MNVPGSDSSALQIAYFGVGLLGGHGLPLAPGREAGAAHAAKARLLQHVDDLLGLELAGQHAAQHAVVLVAGLVRVVRPPLVRSERLGRRPPAGERVGHLVHRDRLLVDRRGGCVVTAPEARHLVQLDVVAVALAQLGEPLLAALQPAREVVADGQLNAPRRLGAEVRIERDQPLDLVQRPPPLARERDQLLARQPAVAALDLGQRRDQARAGEAARACLGARRARHQARSTRTAQNLYSGILPVGSISSIVSTFAAASRKWNGMKQLPRVSRCEIRVFSSIEPRRDVTRT